jgi:hypothetical protein
MATEIQTSAYVADVQTRYATGLQRFIRHVAVPEGGPAITWDHPETLCDYCEACKSAFSVGGRDKVLELYRTEAALPGEQTPPDTVKPVGVSE